jgi:hypothetical protein
MAKPVRNEMNPRIVVRIYPVYRVMRACGMARSQAGLLHFDLIWVTKE